MLLVRATGLRVGHWIAFLLLYINPLARVCDMYIHVYYIIINPRRACARGLL